MLSQQLSLTLELKYCEACGGLWMRRYATKADALAIACNYTGAKETWLFEVSQTFDMEAEHERFWSASMGV